MSAAKFYSHLFCGILFSINPLFSQNRADAKKIIDTLTSPSMHGRGYVAGGDKIAAAYISDQFKGLKLISLNQSSSYFQNFSFPVNTFPGEMEMTFVWSNKKREIGQAGKSFLVSCESPSIKGKFLVIRLDSSVVYNKEKLRLFKNGSSKKSFILVDTGGVRTKEELTYLTNFIKYPRGIKGILIPANSVTITDACFKLSTWDVSMKQSSIPTIMIDYRFRNIDQIDINIESKFLKNHISQNVIACVTGKNNPDSFIVFTAHYDHLGHMGKSVYFPGANDNASGIAMLLSLAKHYALPEHKPNCTVVFMAFGGEEVGLLGSMYYASHPFFEMNKIKFLINMDILGTGDEGITVVNATLFEKEFKLLQEINSENNYLSVIKPRGKAAISDHYYFTEAKVPSFYIYTLGGIKAYHDICDRKETLSLVKFEEIFNLLRNFTAKIDNQ